MSNRTTERRKLLVVANRAPVTYEDGVARRGGGGLVTALAGLIAHHDVTWIASAMSDEDRAIAVERGGSFEETSRDGHAYRLRLVAHDLPAYELFYNVVANPTLWFLQHRLALRPLGPEFREAWDEGYVPVNDAFAAATLEELERAPEAAVLFHDYHLYLAPAVVRSARPDVVSSHFIHIPWPDPDAWSPLPPDLTSAIHAGLLANDVVGFHTDRWRQAFLACVDRFVPGGVRSTRVVAHPIGVDAAEFERRADDPDVLERQAEIEAWRPEQLVVRVDRVDPSKNIVRGFEAFGLLLERHPELHGRVGFLALLAPSREDIPEYVEHAAEIEAAAAAVNERFARDGWRPVELDIADDFPHSLAGYKEFDVLLVNPVYDGLNLVAKEAFLLNTRDGALVLSENAGSHEELGEWAVTVDPFDLSQQADALYEALTLPLGERRRRADAIRADVRAHDIREWIDAQLRDLDAVRSVR
ncbi:MAG TPA: trehalose-6-phosphate synthase [Gaiellaceae bacterium]|nr:trehalose-6-phosphate synthase [Gaiellaceae bacterium]